MIVHFPLKPGQHVAVKSAPGRKAFSGVVFSLVVTAKKNFAVIKDESGHTHHCDFDELGVA